MLLEEGHAAHCVAQVDLNARVDAVRGKHHVDAEGTAVGIAKDIGQDAAETLGENFKRQATSGVEEMGRSKAFEASA